jgi:hypothetical protein
MIFKCSWFNEDDYGPISGHQVLVNAEDEVEALVKGETSLTKMLSGFDANDFEKCECEEITDNEILMYHEITCFG